MITESYVANLLTAADKRRAYDMTWPSNLLGIDESCVHILYGLHLRLIKFKDARINSYSVYQQYIMQQNAKVLHDISSLLDKIDEPSGCSDILSAINHSIPDYMRLHAIIGVSRIVRSKEQAVAFISPEERKTIEKLREMGLTRHHEYEMQYNEDGNVVTGVQLEFVQLSWLGFVFINIIS